MVFATIGEEGIENLRYLPRKCFLHSFTCAVGSIHLMSFLLSTGVPPITPVPPIIKARAKSLVHRGFTLATSDETMDVGTRVLAVRYIKAEDKVEHHEYQVVAPTKTEVVMFDGGDKIYVDVEFGPRDEDARPLKIITVADLKEANDKGWVVRHYHDRAIVGRLVGDEKLEYQEFQVSQS